MITELDQAAGRPVSRETFGTARSLCALAARRRTNAKISFHVERWTHLWERHILDSAQLVRFEPATGRVLGRHRFGAGLPGIVIACLVDGPVTLVEPRRLRANFSARRSNRSAWTPRCRRRRPNESDGTVRCDHRPRSRAARAFPRTVRTICPQERRFGCFPGAEARNPNWPKPNAHGKVCFTWNRVSPTRIRKSSSRRR